MASITAERPQFFEGQYLGAEDLAAIVEYLRTDSARQNLGHHSWGVVVGLDLVASPISDTAVDYFVQPGVAVDGYGRMMVVSEPTPITAEQMATVGAGSGLLDVWIHYDQSEFESTRPGFNACSAEDEYKRVYESFRLVVGNFDTVSQHQSGVTLNEVQVTDARTALSDEDPPETLLCDASVPHQDFPVDDDTALWLVPLGHVLWSSINSNFLPLVDPSEVEELEAGTSLKTSDQVYELQIAGRVKKRLIGVVAEDILAAEGLIRLRKRTNALAPGVEVDVACRESAVQAADSYFCDGELLSKELIWLEGHTRVTGDLRLFDSQLEFKNEVGGDYIDRTVGGQNLNAIQPLLMKRFERDVLDPVAGSDLQVLLGDRGPFIESEGVDFRNRFSIGSVTYDGSELCELTSESIGKIFFQDNGRMGIGTYNPDTTLLSPLTIRGMEIELEVAPGDPPASVLSLINFEGLSGVLEWQLNLSSDNESLSFDEGTAGNSRLHLNTGGNVGISNAAPEAKLDIGSVPVSAGGGDLGSDLWFRVGDGNENGRVWIQNGPSEAPLLVLSDLDAPPRIQFQQTDAPDAEDLPGHSSWFGHQRGGSPDLAIVDAKLGIGTQDTLDEQLSVVRDGGALGLYSGRMTGHAWMGFYNDGGPGTNRAGWFGYGAAGSTSTLR